MFKIPENSMLVIKAVSPLIVVIILFFFLGNIGFTKISQIQDQISQARQDQRVLEEKIDLLRNISLTGTEDSNAVTNSLPDSSPTLASVSQLKNLAAENGLILSSIKAKSDPSGSDDLKSVTITFSILGDKLSILSFLTNMQTLAPILLLNKIKIIESTGAYSGEVTVNSFWSSFPTQLPNTIDGLEDLNEADKQTLDSVNSLRQPVFYNVPASLEAGKENPFEN